MLGPVTERRAIATITTTTMEAPEHHRHPLQVAAWVAAAVAIPRTTDRPIRRHFQPPRPTE